jgi:hypothetical protein
MQTRQLIAGDTLLLEEEKSFCLVVDGLVQVFVKSPPRLAQVDSDDEEWEGGQGYQLLTEAKNGGSPSPKVLLIQLPYQVYSLFSLYLQRILTFQVHLIWNLL